MTLRLTCLAATLALAPAGAALAAEPAWPVAGQQGLVQVVLVPAAAERDREAYARQLQRLCAPERTCFVNFYAAPADGAVPWPLPAAVEQQPTATYRRSTKNGAERFMWACRLQLPQGPCF